MEQDITGLMTSFFRWKAIGQRMVELERQDKLHRGHKILRIYKKSRNRLVKLAKKWPDELPHLSIQELL